MSLATGDRLGGYEITAAIGAGGMGEVYRARDTRLNRDVAIKIIPASFALDPERVARFRREAQTLASLNHPNIAHIHGLEEGDGILALVMELVDGEDLSQRIAGGAIPLDEALAIARQIADALEAAHEQGIVHRDLKPANIKVRPDGTVKVLDFGLAKATAPATGSSDDVANSPTLTDRATQMGLILGTAAYMAPEQARGKTVDRRADIWAFGVVLYEMLTGRRAFDGHDISDVLASVLKSDPAWTALPTDTPAYVRRVLRRCLEKDVRRRLNSIADARLDLEEIEPVTVPAAMLAAAQPSRHRVPIGYGFAALAGILVTIAVLAALRPKTSDVGTSPLVRSSLLQPPGADLYPDSTGVAISPDGTMVAFVVGAIQRSQTQLWVRALDSTSARRLEGGDGAIQPFWSRDSRRIGFFSGAKLKTISVSGGRADTLADAPAARGGAWNASNVIIYAPDASGPLFRVSATGGTPQQITTLDSSRKEYGHRFPVFLPDGDHFLYAALPSRNGKFDILAGSLSTPGRTLVGSAESAVVYADPGWLLFSRQNALAAQAFDARSLKLSGDPIALEDEPTMILDPNTSYTSGRPASVSSSGALAYYSAASNNTTLSWYDEKGQRTGGLDIPAGHYESSAIAPDGAHAIVVRSTSASESALWMIDLARASAAPFSSGRGRNDNPVWSPDGTRVVFAADRDGGEDIFQKSTTDAADEAPIYRSDRLFKAPTSFSPDGQWIVVNQIDPGTAHDIWLLRPGEKPELKPYYAGPTRDNAGPVSPNGRWLAYETDETGRFQLDVQSFPQPGHKVQVSDSGALFEWWTPDGRSLVYVADDVQTIWRADVSEMNGSLTVQNPVRLGQFPNRLTHVDATPDRKHFLGISPARSGPGSITIVQNWRAGLEKR
jgi:eukaryotic-like serine/threonine-protein kinase